jgi:hypothetical protein
MTGDTFQQGKFIAISDCEICSHLGDLETSFFKYAHEDMTELLPPEASRLLRLEGQVSDTDRRTFWRCPICGTFYLYKITYEYLVYGSEDEEELIRATPAQAKRFLSGQEYVDLIEWLRRCLQHPNVETRRFAAKCLASHHLERNEIAAIARYLRHPDQEVVLGAMIFLSQYVKERYEFSTLWELRDTLLDIDDGSEGRVASVARFLARNIGRYGQPKPVNNPDAQGKK